MADGYTMEIAIGAIFLIFLLIYKYMTSEYSYWKDRKVPFIKPSFPFGNIKDQVTNKSDTGSCFKALYDQMPGERYFGIFELGKPTLVLKDPELIKAVMVTDFYCFVDRGHIHEDVKKDYLAAFHLFNLKNEAWKAMRAKIVPTFTSGRMKQMYQLMFKCSQQLDNHLENVTKNNDLIDFKDLLARFTSDVISSCFFGLETNAIVEKDSEVRKISRIVFPTSTWTMVKLLLSINHPYIYDFLGLEVNYERVKKFCMQVAKDTYNYRVNNNVYRDDFVDLLIKVKQNKNLYEDEKQNNQGSRQSDGPNDGLTFEEMAAQIFVLFAAGFETSSTTSSLALLYMCEQPEILAKATEEVDEVLQKHNGQITYQALKEMAYLEQVMYETLRLYPPLPILTRKCTKPCRMPGTDLTIEKGTRIIIPSYALNRDPEFFPDPEKFDPDRFSPKNFKEHRINLHFGDGPMICVGLRFGKMQMKCAMATILSKFTLSVSPETPNKIILNPRQFLLTPINPIYLKATRRQDR